MSAKTSIQWTGPTIAQAFEAAGFPLPDHWKGIYVNPEDVWACGTTEMAGDSPLGYYRFGDLEADAIGWGADPQDPPRGWGWILEPLGTLEDNEYDTRIDLAGLPAKAALEVLPEQVREFPEVRN